MKHTLYINGKIILQDGILEQGSLLTVGDRIREIRPGGERQLQRELREEADEVVDLQGKYLAPGFIDIHVHGGGGGDFMDGERESWQQALETHLRHGTTALCPTTLTAATEEMERVFSLYREFRREQTNVGPRLLGLHMEGPYIAESMKGAQDARYIRKPEREFTGWLLEKGAGVLRILTAAPELEGMEEVARAAAFLASEEAGYITGQVLCIDGGMAV